MEDDEIIVVADIKSNSNKKDKKKSKKKKNKKTNNKKNKVRTSNNAQNVHKHKVKKTIGIIIIIIILLLIIFSSSLFDIKNIKVNGNEKLSDEMVISLSGLQLHNNIFKFNKSEVIENIKENAYVEKIELVRKFPSTVDITIEERKVKYMLQYADSFAYINNQGYILEVTNKKQEVPILIGYSTYLSNVKTGERITVEDLKKMDMVIKIFETAKSNDLGSLITKIDISDDRNYTIILETEGKTVYLGDGSDLNTKILYLSSILEASSGKTGEIFLNVDLNSDNAYFRPSSN